MFAIQEFINCRQIQTPPTSQIRGISLDLIFAVCGPRSCSMSFHRQPQPKINSRLPLGAKAIQIADGRVSNYFLTTLGRAKRETVCSCEVVWNPACHRHYTFKRRHHQQPDKTGESCGYQPERGKRT